MRAFVLLAKTPKKGRERDDKKVTFIGHGSKYMYCFKIIIKLQSVTRDYYTAEIPSVTFVQRQNQQESYPHQEHGDAMTSAATKSEKK